MNSLILHVGLPKVASTFFQRKVFPSLQDVVYVHKSKDDASFKFIKLLRDCLRKEHVLVSRVKQFLPDPIVEMLRGGIPVVASDENLSISSMDIWEGTGCSPEAFSQRLSVLCEILEVDIYIAVMHRDLPHWFASRYAQSAPRFASPGQEDFEFRIAKLAENISDAPSVGWLSKTRVREAFSAALGENRIVQLELKNLNEVGVEAFWGRLNLPCDITKIDNAFTKRTNTRRVSGDTWRLRGSEKQISLNDGLFQNFNVIEKFLQV